jgi:hypothetical protein
VCQHYQVLAWHRLICCNSTYNLGQQSDSCTTCCCAHTCMGTSTILALHPPAQHVCCQGEHQLCDQLGDQVGIRVVRSQAGGVTPHPILKQALIPEEDGRPCEHFADKVHSQMWHGLMVAGVRKRTCIAAVHVSMTGSMTTHHACFSKLRVTPSLGCIASAVLPLAPAPGALLGVLASANRGSQRRSSRRT